MGKTASPWRRNPRARVLAAGAVIVVAVLAAAAVLLASPRTIYLTISNQSTDHPFANLTVLVDGQVAASGAYFVDNQHNYTQVDVRATAGRVEVREADTGAQAAHVTWRLGDRWVVIQFWGGAPCCDPITVSEFDRPPAFG